MKRIIAFDYIRIISITGIILCHFLYNYDSCRSLAGWLGNTFNTIFITLSAFLIGFKWENKNRQVLKLSFFTNRIKKLSFTYYPYLLLMFLFIFFIEQQTPKIGDIVLHFSFFPILQRIPNWGHLWFISLIVLCYLSIYLYTKITTHIKINAAVVVLISIIALIIVQFCNFTPILSNCIVYICTYVLIFTNTRPLMAFIEKQNSIQKVLIYLLLVAVCIILAHNKNFNKSNLHGLIIGVFSAILLFIVMFNLFNNKKANNFVCFISEISFEIYLVHNIFTLSDYSLAKHIENPILALICILTICITSGYCLKKISIERFIKK